MTSTKIRLLYNINLGTDAVFTCATACMFWEMGTNISRLKQPGNMTTPWLMACKSSSYPLPLYWGDTGIILHGCPGGRAIELFRAVADKCLVTYPTIGDLLGQNVHIVAFVVTGRNIGKNSPQWQWTLWVCCLQRWCYIRVSCYVVNCIPYPQWVKMGWGLKLNLGQLCQNLSNTRDPAYQKVHWWQNKWCSHPRAGCKHLQC